MWRKRRRGNRDELLNLLTEDIALQNEDMRLRREARGGERERESIGKQQIGSSRTVALIYF